MKNKKLTVFIIIFSLLLAVIILSSAVFSLKFVEVDFMSETTVLTSSEDSIIESGGFKFGENIFLSNKNTYKNTIEKANPYLRIVNIETKFPSKLIIHAVERSECYVIKLSNGSYAFTDEYLKVLRISNVFSNNSTNGLELKNSGLESQEVQEGDFFKTDGYLKTIFKCFLEWKNSPTYADVREKIIGIQLDYQKENQLLVKMKSGVQIVVENYRSELSLKLNTAFSIYDTTTKNGEPVDYAHSGTIFILENQDNIYGLYRA